MITAHEGEKVHGHGGVKSSGAREHASGRELLQLNGWGEVISGREDSGVASGHKASRWLKTSSLITGEPGGRVDCFVVVTLRKPSHRKGLLWRTR